jgi:peptidoglycan/LPS O-acetylase OafA/YrhL
MSTVRPIPALTSIRGLAAWWVVLYHFREEIPGIAGTSLLRFMGNGYLAVDLFFELSGFVIALNYARTFRSVTWADSMNFLGLRLARIYPLHIFILFVFLINPIAIALFSTYGQPGDRYSPGYFILSVFLVQNWGFTRTIAWNAPAWSLSTEWAAYLLFPFMAWVSVNTARTAVRAAALAALPLGLLVVVSAVTGYSLGSEIPQFGLLRCILEFATGVCLFHLWQARGRIRRFEGDIASMIAALLAIAFIVWPIPDYLVFPLLFFVLIYALTDDRALLSRLLAFRAIEWVGIVSYSTYMVHYLIKDWVKFLLVRDYTPSLLPFLCYLAITALASALLYAYIEVPGRRALRAWLVAHRRPSPVMT